MIYAMKVFEGLSDSRGVVHWFVGTLIAAAATALLAFRGSRAELSGVEQASP